MPFKPFPCPYCGHKIDGFDLDGNLCGDCLNGKPSCHACQWPDGDYTQYPIDN